MGADIHSLVQRRVIEPKFVDAQMRVAERAYRQGALPLEEWEEKYHTITWAEVVLLTFDKSLPFDATRPWEDNFVNNDPDITPWYADRNYGLFGILADVRPRGGRPIEGGPYRGCPEGAEDPGDHSCTWYMCQELVDAGIEERMPEDYGVTNDVTAFIQMNKDLVKKYGPRDVRIILSFDS